MDTLALLQFYRKHIEEVLLPFWIRALDHRYGGVYTCFNNTGDRLISKDKYSWSQGRFLWLWSKAAAMVSEKRLTGEIGAFNEHARKTALFLEENVFLDTGNCAFLLTETGVKKESIPGKGYDISIYADCFVAIGLAEYAGLMKNLNRYERALHLYRRIVDRIDCGDFRSEPYPVPDGYRTHSIPMILLNVSQVLEDVAARLNHPRDEELHQDSIGYMNDIMENFYQPDHRVVELLPAGQSEKLTLLYRHVNPGHTIESMWFVMYTARKTGNSDFILKAVQAVEKAVNIGWDIDYGGLFRFVDRRGGKPEGEKGHSPIEELITDTWDMKLWWPHSEALYATLLGFILTGNEKMLEFYKKIHNYVFKTFPNHNQTIGEWIQIRDRQGKPLDKVAALPVKDPFHILRNMLLIMELLENQIKTKSKTKQIWQNQ